MNTTTDGKYKQPKLLVDKECPVCKNKFTPTWSGRKHCSRKCADLSKRTTPEFSLCETCGKKTKNKRGRIRRFCSQQCFWKAPKEKVLEERNCPNCKKTFRPRWDIQEFCSRKCGYQNRSLPRGNCLHCGKSLEGKPTRVKYCSHQCHALDRPKRGKVDEAIGTIKNAGYGYLKIKIGKEHLSADKKGWVLHHRYMMEQHLGRKLLKTEHIHHRNGNRADNRIENLELILVKKHTPGIRSTDLLEELMVQPEIVQLSQDIQGIFRTVLTRFLIAEQNY